ncbi:MAG: hypothetical protein QOF58_3928 [Pseudonocardiales bacterium]|jgi:hypothetical protein|nr:hypothetical protein [Pseudonocardiales bacterium]
MDLDSLFGDSSTKSTDVDTIDADAEVQDVEELVELEEADEASEEDENGIGWKALALFICGGLVITALAVAFMVWVIEGLVL